MIVKTGNVGPSIKITDGSVGRRGEREIGKGSVLIMGGALMNNWEWGGVNENKRGKGSGEAAVENRFPSWFYLLNRRSHLYIMFKVLLRWFGASVLKL